MGIPLCPFKMINHDTSSTIVGVTPKSKEAECVMGRCAIYITQSDEHGRPVGGACALALSVQTQGGIVQNTGVLATMLGDYLKKISAAAAATEKKETTNG